MVSLISIGIEEYKKASGDCSENIPCAYQDAKRVYETFETVLEDDMKRYASACIKNVTALECRALLSTMKLSVDKEDILVLYFSGHGITDANGKLKLLFADYGYTERKGVIALEEIVSTLKEYECKIILILDCCYSGAGVSESENDDFRLEHCISIISSNGSIGKARFTEDGSEFTNYLCDSLLSLHELYEDISLDKIYKYITEKKKYDKCKIITGGGNADICLRSKESTEFPSDFVIKFVDKVFHVNYEMREALWYSVCDLPVAMQVKIVDECRRCNKDVFAEMSWRVRRAMGSIFANSTAGKMSKQIEELINADNWMEKCIGYIGLNKQKDSWVTECMEKELKNDIPMDLKWLLVLYLAERENVDTELILASGLMETVWGAIEVWKRYPNFQKEEKQQFFKKHTDAKVYKQFCLELFFREKDVTINLEEYDDLLQKCMSDLKDLYGGNSRGRRQKTKINKWIFSILYGNWRDQLDLNTILNKKIRSMRETKKRDFLQAIKYIPSVEVRMAVLDFFVTQMKVDGMKDKFDVNDLAWALQDEHPWVIRTALPLFEDNKDLVCSSIRSPIDMKLYPGVFDLDIELEKNGLDNVGYKINDMTHLEKQQLKWAKEKEQQYRKKI